MYCKIKCKYRVMMTERVWLIMSKITGTIVLLMLHSWNMTHKTKALLSNIIIMNDS